MTRIFKVTNGSSIIASPTSTERNSKMKRFFVSLVLMTLMLSTMSAYADTPVIGFIDQDTTWTNADSPYTAFGHVIVKEGVTLTIEPGVIVSFDSGHGLKIEGTLIARGTETEHITFPSQTGWQGIIFEDSSSDAQSDEDHNYLSGSILQYCIIEHAETGVTCRFASPFIDHCEINKNEGAGISISGGDDVVIRDSIIANNNASGIIATGSNSVILVGNTVAGNKSTGISIKDGNFISINDCIVRNQIKRGKQDFFGTYQGNGTSGGLRLIGHTIILADNTIEDNQAIGYSAFAGGAYILGDNITINNNTISRNAANAHHGYGEGGGIVVSVNNQDDVIIVLDGNTFTENRVSGGSPGVGHGGSSYGGGIYIEDVNGGILTIHDNAFVGNTSTPGGGGWGAKDGSANGGAIFLKNSEATVSKNTFTENLGGLYVSGSLVTISKNDFSANSHWAIFTSNSTGTIDRNTFTENENGVFVDKGKTTAIIGNTFTGTSGTWVLAYDGHGEIVNNLITENLCDMAVTIVGTPKFNRNAIFDNQTDYSLHYGESKNSPAFDATNNYWGATTEVEIRTKIYDFFKDESLALVNVVPFLTECPSIAEEAEQSLKNKIPVASFTVTPRNPSINEEVTFDASGSNDPDGQIVSYEWDFGDMATGIGQVTKHAYSSAGRYMILLTVTDNEGEATETTHPITVAPSVTIQVTTQSHNFGEVVIGESVDWILAISNIGEANLRISDITSELSVFTVAAPEFPQDIPGEVVPAWQNPAEPAQSPPMKETDVPQEAVKMAISAMGITPANFEVKKGEKVVLSVSNQEKWSHIFRFKDQALKKVAVGVGPDQTRMITFYAPSEAGQYEFFCAVPGHEARGENGQMVARTVEAPGFPQNVPTGGTLEVTVRFSPVEEMSYLNSIVIDSNDPDKPELSILLEGKGKLPEKPPVASFVFTPENPAANGEIIFDASGSYDPDGKIISYEWDFGNGLAASEVETSHSYDRAGSHTVSLTVTNNEGDTDVQSLDIMVSLYPNEDAAVPITGPPTLLFANADEFKRSQIYKAVKQVLNVERIKSRHREKNEDVIFNCMDALLHQLDPAQRDKDLLITDMMENIELSEGAELYIDFAGGIAAIAGSVVLLHSVPAVFLGTFFGETMKELGFMLGEYAALEDFHCVTIIYPTIGRMEIVYRPSENKILVNTYLEALINRNIFIVIPVEHSPVRTSWGGYMHSIAWSGVTVPPEAAVREPRPKIEDVQIIGLGSPGELRVYDSKGMVTGLVEGEVSSKIPNAYYYNETIVIFGSSDSYRYEVVGTEEGLYGLEVVSVVNGKESTFVATDIPTAPQALHQYSVDWDVLANGKNGVTIEIDIDGDGEPESVVIADSELTSDEYLIATGVTPQGKNTTTWGFVRQTKLLQNYPNPFNPETWIPYQLVESGEVRIRIYGSGGSLVRQFELGNKPAGFYLSKEKAAYWDGRDKTGEQVASGIYFYSLQAGEFTEIRKMVILR